MSTNLMFGGACAILALLLLWWIYRRDPKRDWLPPPTKDVNRPGPGAVP